MKQSYSSYDMQNLFMEKRTFKWKQKSPHPAYFNSQCRIFTVFLQQKDSTPSLGFKLSGNNQRLVCQARLCSFQKQLALVQKAVIHTEAAQSNCKMVLHELLQLDIIEESLKKPVLSECGSSNYNTPHNLIEFLLSTRDTSQENCDEWSEIECLPYAQLQS